MDVEIRRKSRSQKFALLLACASMSMLFVAFTSAWIVREAKGNWQEFPIPNVFYVSTIVILLSSLAIHMAKRFLVSGKEIQYKVSLLLSFAFGIGFVVCQFKGWDALKAIGIYIDGNPSGSFVYLISIAHLLHVVGGLGAILLANIHGFTLPFKATPARVLRLELTSIFWHFVDFLWIYLIGFMVVSLNF